MGCDTWNDKLDAYFDGELPVEQARSLAQHLRGCSACSADGLARVQQKLSVRAAAQRFTPDPAFRSRIEKMIKPGTQPSRVGRWLAILASAAVLILATVFIVRSQGRAQQQVLGELADLHVATLASSNPVDVVSTDRHTVKPWFEGKLPFTFNLPDLQGTAFTLVGGRVAYLNRSPGGEMLFRIRQHRVSLFIFQDRAVRDSGGSERQTAFSFNVISWNHNGLRYFLIGDVGSEDLKALSELLRSAG